MLLRWPHDGVGYVVQIQRLVRLQIFYVELRVNTNRVFSSSQALKILSINILRVCMNNSMLTEK